MAKLMPFITRAVDSLVFWYKLKYIFIELSEPKNINLNGQLNKPYPFTK